MGSLFYDLFMKSLKISEERNEMAHHHPPYVKDHMNPDDTVNWGSVETAFEATKRRVRAAYASHSWVSIPSAMFAVIPTARSAKPLRPLFRSSKYAIKR